MNEETPALTTYLAPLVAMLFLPLLYALFSFKKNNRNAGELRKNERKVESEAQKQLNQAVKDAELEKEEATSTYKSAMSKSVKDLENRYVDVREDTQKVNDFLKDVGNKVRGND